MGTKAFLKLYQNLFCAPITSRITSEDVRILKAEEKEDDEVCLYSLYTLICLYSLYGT